jgi:hypothetical protein
MWHRHHVRRGAAWHYFKIDGFLAFLIAGAGLTLVGKAFNVEL